MGDKVLLIEQYKVCADLYQNSLDQYIKAKIFCTFSLIGLLFFSILFRFTLMGGIGDFSLVCLWNIFFYASIIIMFAVVFADIKYRKEIIHKREKVLHKIEKELGWNNAGD